MDNSEPFVLERNQLFVHDFSRFIENLGHDFVLASCVEIRRVRAEFDILHSTWISNYVTRLAALFDSFIIFRFNDGSCLTPAYETDSKRWCEFANWLGDEINFSNCSEETKSKTLQTTNNLLFLLNVAKVLPVPVSILYGLPRLRAKHGESRFTKPGWRWSDKTTAVTSAFAFELDIHKRSYDYSKYRRLGAPFLLAFIMVVRQYFTDLKVDGAKHSYNVTINFLDFLIIKKDSSDSESFFDQLKSDFFRSIGCIAWEKMIYAWRDDHALGVTATQPIRSLITAHKNVLNFRDTWAALAENLVVPSVTIVGYKNAKKKNNSAPRRSLAQLTPADVLDDKALKVAFTSVGKFFDESEQQQVFEFTRALCAELSPSVVQGLSTESLIEQIQSLNSRRLVDLRACAELDFIKWYTHWERGQIALQNSSFSGPQLVDLLDSASRSVTERRRNSTALLKAGPDSIRLGNALNLVLEVYGGIVTGINGRYHHLKLSFGGTAAFNGYLHPHSHASVALWILLLIDSGANCEVVREMPFRCIEESNNILSKTVIFAAKERASGKIIVDELPITPTRGQSISSIEAIEKYQRMTAVYRSQASAEFSNKLFIDERKRQIVGIDEWVARSWFVEFLERHECLKHLAVLPSMIRPSVLLETQFRSPEGAVAAQIVADHMSMSTTLQHYTGRMPVKLQYVNKIREFQDRYQAVVIASIDGAAAKLGISDSDFKRIFSDAARTGLGVACLDPLAGIQPGTSPGVQCTKLDACCGCEMRWVVGTVSNIVDLILFSEHLLASQDNAIAMNSAIWERRWLPWLVFADIALTKLSQGETAAAFAEASQQASIRRQTYQPLPLF